MHFYVPYPGLNDRFLQEAVVECYRRLSPVLNVPAKGVAPDGWQSRKTRRSRVGFSSKFFGEHEPHGLLLEGVVAHLPRDRFVVVVLPIASPGRPAASVLLRSAADEVRPLGLNFKANQQIVVDAKLDVLVFADMLSEPMARVSPRLDRPLTKYSAAPRLRCGRLPRRRAATTPRQ